MNRTRSGSDAAVFEPVERRNFPLVKQRKAASLPLRVRFTLRSSAFALTHLRGGRCEKPICTKDLCVVFSAALGLRQSDAFGARTFQISERSEVKTLKFRRSSV